MSTRSIPSHIPLREISLEDLQTLRHSKESAHKWLKERGLKGYPKVHFIDGKIFIENRTRTQP